MSVDSDRQALLRELDWAPPQVDLSDLTTGEIRTIATWVAGQLAERNHCSIPGTSYVQKERRRGRTNRLGWRWVVYVGDTIDRAHEVTMCTTRAAANTAKRKAHARYWARQCHPALNTHASSRSRDRGHDVHTNTNQGNE